MKTTRTELYTISTEIEVEKLDLLLSQLQEFIVVTKANSTILIFGQGSKTRVFYRRLREDSDITVHWTGWCGSRWSRIFSFIPGQAGLLEIQNLERTKEL